jgi:hypothetical protein
MTRRQHARRQSRRTLVWRVFYGSGELIGQGSVVDVHENGCRVTGRMPVEGGTRLRLCIWPTDNPPIFLSCRARSDGREDLNLGCSSMHICRTLTNWRARRTRRLMDMRQAIPHHSHRFNAFHTLVRPPVYKVRLHARMPSGPVYLRSCPIFRKLLSIRRQ